MIRDYCIQKTIKKGKEEKVYGMLCKANSLIRFGTTQEYLKGKKVLERAERLINAYDISAL